MRCLPLAALSALALSLAACAAPAGEPEVGDDPSTVPSSDSAPSRATATSTPSGAVTAPDKVVTPAPSGTGTGSTGMGGKSDPSLRIFVTSLAFSGDLVAEAQNRQIPVATPTTPAKAAAAMLESADGLCGLVAASAGLGKGWKAYMSTPGAEGVTAQRAMDRFGASGPWLRTDGQVAFKTKAAFLVSPLVPINVTETGAVIGADDNNGVWTATDGNGNAVAPGNACGWFHNNDNPNDHFAPFRGTVGNSSLVGTQWQSYSQTFYCSDMRRLYCMQDR